MERDYKTYANQINEARLFGAGEPIPLEKVPEQLNALARGSVPRLERELETRGVFLPEHWTILDLVVTSALGVTTLLKEDLELTAELEKKGVQLPNDRGIGNLLHEISPDALRFVREENELPHVEPARISLILETRNLDMYEGTDWKALLPRTMFEIQYDNDGILVADGVGFCNIVYEIQYDDYDDDAFFWGEVYLPGKWDQHMEFLDNLWGLPGFCSRAGKEKEATIRSWGSPEENCLFTAKSETPFADPSEFTTLGNRLIDFIAETIKAYESENVV